MKNLAIVVDSTAVINDTLKSKYNNIYIAPLQILFGDEVFHDLIDIDSASLFTKMESSSYLPTTSQPSVGYIMDLFEKLLEDYQEILYITISSKISGTYQNGLLAAKQFDSSRISVFDSLSTSCIEYAFVEKALELSQNNQTKDDIIQALTTMRDNSGIFLCVDDLAHLGRTGRISNTGAIVGGLLKIKPILQFVNGEIHLKQKVRTLSRAHLEMIQMMKSEIKDTSIIQIAHAGAKDLAIAYQLTLQDYFPNHTIDIHELSPVISIHTGPRTLGIAWIK
ncbi:MAG: DegV family protein [Bacilli bacterium]|nr:DegV family protein [Bacilli bacterium]